MTTNTTRQLESRLEDLFRREIRRIGGRTDKLAPITKGIPDRLVLLPTGLMFLVELKAEGGKLSPAQVLYHTHARELGHTVVVLSGKIEILRWVWTMEKVVNRRKTGMGKKRSAAEQARLVAMIEEAGQ